MLAKLRVFLWCCTAEAHFVSVCTLVLRVRRIVDKVHADAVVNIAMTQLPTREVCAVRGVVSSKFEQHSAGFQIAPAFAVASFCGFSRGPLATLSQFPIFRTSDSFLACTYDGLRLFPSSCTTFEILVSCAFRNYALRLRILSLLDRSALLDLLS